MYFGGTAARSSAIPTPSTGMTSYIGVTGTATIPQIETYTGSAWQTPYGLTLLANVPYSSATSVTIDNVFTTQYTNYRIMLDTTAITSAGNLTATLRTAAPADLNAASYTYVNTGFSHSAATTPSSLGSSSGGTSSIVGFVNGTPNNLVLDLLNVTIAQPTMMNGISNCSSPTDIFGAVHAGAYKVSVAAFGIRFNFTANTTGTVRIYGYRNS